MVFVKLDGVVTVVFFLKLFKVGARPGAGREFEWVGHGPILVWWTLKFESADGLNLV